MFFIPQLPGGPDNFFQKIKKQQKKRVKKVVWEKTGGSFLEKIEF